jgi:hypothetical protein
MTTLTVNIPEKDKKDLSSFVKERGGEIVTAKNNSRIVGTAENEEEDDVNHSEFFGENIRRAINILRKH